MKKTIFATLLAAFTLSATAQTSARKVVLSNSSDGQSELTVYIPSATDMKKSGGRAILCCPGGGYSHLSMENEGHNWAGFFNEQGMAFAVLKYRMPKGDRNIPLSDAYQAMRTLRDSASVWGIDPQQVGIMGFSAGGHLASSVSTHAPSDARPNFAILFYPVISMDVTETHKGSVVNFLGPDMANSKAVYEWSNQNAVDSVATPPTLLLLANDDNAVPPHTNAAPYYAALRRNRIQAEMHIYPTGGHGFGFRDKYKYHNRMLGDIKEWLTALRIKKN